MIVRHSPIISTLLFKFLKSHEENKCRKAKLYSFKEQLPWSKLQCFTQTCLNTFGLRIIGKKKSLCEMKK